MKRRTENAGKILDEFFARAPKPSQEQLDASRRRVLEGLELRNTAIEPEPAGAGYHSNYLRFAAIAATAAVLVAGTIAFFRLPNPGVSSAVAESADGLHYRFGDIVRSNGSSGMFLKLADTSRIEMRAHSELRLESAQDGTRIRLNSGGVIVTAAKQRTGHLYVQTKDVLVSVVGTVFLVNTEEEGSRVAVIQGEVRVQQGASEKKLLPGDQVATSPRMVSVPMTQELSWSPNVLEHLALLQQSLAALGGALQQAAPAIAVPRAPAIPKWEAVSIKPCSPDPSVRGGGRGGLYVRPARLIMTCMPVKFAIQDAYVRSAAEVLKHPASVSISGGPGWINSDLYSIEAKAEGRPIGQIMEGPMLQALLEDRFKLKIRREVREVPVYELVVDKGGPKIEPLKDEDCSSKWIDPAQDERSPEERLAELKATGPGSKFFDGKACGASRFGPSREPGKPSQIDFYGMNFDDIASGLRVVLDRDVINKTGLTGLYHFHLTFQPDQTTSNGLFHAAPFDDTPTGAPYIFKAIQEQMGMRLDSAKGPGESFIIESIERPAEN
jgi:uncharacterized protein (TIGR03435 family)